MLQTDRLILLPPTLDHVEPLMAVFGNADAMRYIGDGSPRTFAQVQVSFQKRFDSLQQHGVTLWTVQCTQPIGELAAGTILGDCGLIPVNWQGPEFELAYRFRPESWGHGVAAEAAAAAMDHAWGVLKVPHVLGLCYSGNVGSWRVLERTGFVHRGQTERYYDTLLEWFTMSRPRG